MWPLLRSAAAGYTRHASSELAAALAYRILFALVPFIALLAALVEPLLSSQARADLVDWMLGAFPGATVQAGVEQELASTGAITSVAGIVAFGTLAWTASGMTRSLRVALAVVWETHEPPTFVRAKLRDLAALGVLAALLLAVFGLSLAAQIALQAGADTAEAIGFTGAGVLARVVELTLTLGATFAALVLVYRLAAPVRPAMRDVWRGALATAVAIDVGLAAYAFYLVQLASFDTIYGPLGAVLAFLALLYVAAVCLLFGAELVVLTERSTTARSAR
jgi:membrane protein